MSITEAQRKAVKGYGFLSNKDGEHFSARIITVNGVVSANQMKTISEAASLFGNGKVSFTSRLTVELPGIKFEDIGKVQEYLAKEQLITGGTGTKVRPIVACKGTVCVFGNIDTQSIAAEIHQRFYEGYSNVKLPHKFKIGVGGCPNNCVKPDLNDFGIVGQKVPIYDECDCKGCKKCGIVNTCPMKACSMEKNKLKMDKTICNNCGKCITKCYFNAMKGGTVGYRAYIGGRWGKSIRIGTPLSQLFNKDEILDVLEKSILLFKGLGITGERFSDTIERIGFKEAEELLMSNVLLEKKDAILRGDWNAE